MEVIWLLKKQPVSRHQIAYHLHLDIQTGSLNKVPKDEFHRTSSRPSTAALPRKALPLIAAFASVTVVVFSAYLCSFSIRRSTHTSSRRSLMASSGGEESDGSGSCATKTDEIPGASQDLHSQLSPSSRVPFSVEPGHAESEARDLMSPLLEGTAAVPAERVRDSSRPQLAAIGEHKHLKRKVRGKASVQRKTKFFRVDNDLTQETLAGPPPLDPHFDALIDSVLHEIEASLDTTWVLDYETAHFSSSALQSESAPSSEESGDQHSTSPRTLKDQVSPRLSGDLPAQEGNGLTSTTWPHSFDYVLSEAHAGSQGLSPDDWLSGSEAEVVGEALRVMASSEAQHALPGNVEDPKETAKSHRPLSDAASKGQIDSLDLFSSENPQGDSFGQGPAQVSLRAAATEASMAREQGMTASTLNSPILLSLLSSTLHSSVVLPSLETVAEVPGQRSGSAKHTDFFAASEVSQSDSSQKRPAHVSPRVAATEASTAGEQGVTTSTINSPILRSLLSSASETSTTRISSETTAEPPGQTSEPEKLLSERAQAATNYLFASFQWLREMLKGISNEVLKMHPFYRHPRKQESLDRKIFSQENAVSSRIYHMSSIPLLSECRNLLMKPQLTKEELDELVDYTERLSRYASTRMPAHDRACTTVFCIETLGKVFLFLDTLHCASEVLGDASRKGEWWPSIVHHIENAKYRGGFSEQLLRRPCWSYPILYALNVVLDHYRIGKRPPLQLVVGLKSALFLSPMSTEFKSSRWDPWREDAKAWLKSIKATSPAN